MHHELSPCQVRIFIKTWNFHLFWIVQFHHWCYSTISCKAAWSAKVQFASYWVIIDVAQAYRIPSDSLFITTLSIIETYPWAWECAFIAHLYWNWYDAIFWFVTLSLIQCIYVLKCRVTICLDNWFMIARPQVPPTFTRTNAVFLGSSFVIYVIQLHKYILHVELIHSVVSILIKDVIKCTAYNIIP